MDDREIRILRYFTSVKVSENKTILKAPHTTINLSVKREDVNKILDALKEGTTLKELKQQTELSENDLNSILHTLNEEGALTIEESGDHIQDYYQRYFSKDLEEEFSDKSVLLVGLGPIGARILKYLQEFDFKNLMALDWKSISERDRCMYDFEVERDSKRSEIMKKRFPDLDIRDAAPEDLDSMVDRFDLIVFCNSGARSDDHLINEICVNEDVPWIGIRYSDDVIEIGPTVIPGKTACYNCYDRRMESNSKNPELLRKYRSKKNWGKNAAVPPYGLGVVESISMDEILANISKSRRPETADGVFKFNIHPYKLERHGILRLPHCEVCETNEI